MTFGGNRRAQSTVVGVTLVFGLLIISLGTIQAFVVPQQNAAVAQQHWENARNDMTRLRSVMDRVASRESSASVAIKLGQRLPDRPFLVEGTPPSGTLETRPVAITIRGTNYSAPADEDDSGVIEPDELNGSSPTKELRYRQSGGDWQTLTSFIGPVSTFVKQDGRVSQAVVESGDRIDVLILKGNLSAGGVSTENVEITGASRSCAAIEGDSGDEIEVERTGSPDRTIDWASGDVRQVCLLVVSINNKEVDPPRLTPDPGSTGGSNSTLFNPTRPLLFECAEEDNRGSNSTKANFSFTNVDNVSHTIDRARIAAYQDGESSGGAEVPDQGEIIRVFASAAGYDTSGRTPPLPVAGASVDITSDIDFNPGDTRKLIIDFDASDQTRLDTIVLRFTIADGDILRYYIQIQKPGECSVAVGGGGGGGGGGTASDVTASGGSAGVNGDNAGVQFDLSNGGSTDATITDIKIETTASSAKQIAEDNTTGPDIAASEVYIDSGTAGRYEAGGDSTGSPNVYTLGNTVALSSDAVINAGNTATVYLYRFEKNNGNGVNMSGEQVTVTITFSDGSSKEYTINT